MKKRTKITLSILCSFFAILFVAVMIYYFGDSYKTFYSLSKQSFAIPGLETKFVPQGLDHDQENQKFLVSGYMSNGEPSRIYVINQQSGKTEKFFTLTINEKAYTGHCGGIAVNGDYGFVVGDKEVIRFNYSSALALKNGESLEIIDKFIPGNGADFVLINSGKLIVGEFYKQGKYDTPTNHHIKINNNETNFALAYAYSINQTKEFGIESQTPEYCISLPNQVQGMNFTKDGNIILSTSYSIPKSKLLIYENVLNQSTEKTITLKEQEIPLYILSSNTHLQTIEAPAMSEELVLVDGKVYILFESACSKYKLVNREQIKNVYALNV